MAKIRTRRLGTFYSCKKKPLTANDQGLLKSSVSCPESLSITFWATSSR